MHHSRKKYIHTFVVPGVITMFGVFLFTMNSIFMDMILTRILILSPNSFITNIWQHPKMDIFIDMYFFNWTNPEDFTNHSIKPKFKEMGPYKFFETYDKVDVVFYDNGTVSHRNKKTFYFLEDESNGSMKDNVTYLNVVAMTAVEISKNWNYFFRKALGVVLNPFAYETTKPIEDILFTGYRDPLLDAAKLLPFLEGIPKLEQFAWFLKRNTSASYEGELLVGTGKGNTTFGMLYEWNHKDHGPYPGQCSSIRASSSGELFPQNVAKGKLSFFFADFCRAITLDYKETVSWNGIEGYKFVGDVSFLDSGNKENACLCKDTCRKFGVVDYHFCRPEIIGYLSLPHFLKADKSYREDVEGMKPDMKKHELYMIVNPRTGLVLDVDIVIQVNLLTKPNDGIRKYANIPEVMMPMFWFSVKVRQSKSIQWILKYGLMFPSILKFVSAVLIILGIALSLVNTRRQVHDAREKAGINYFVDDNEEEMKPLGKNNIIIVK